MNPDPSYNVPLQIVQGTTLIRQIQYLDPYGNPVNLNRYTAAMDFRSTVQDTGNPIISLSTSNSSIVINGVAGTVTFTISSTITSTLTDGQKMVYNLFIYSPTNIVTSLIAGPAYVEGSTI